MATIDDTPASFTEAGTRKDEMHRRIDQWLTDLTERVEDAAASEEFQAWLDVQSRFVQYSPRNTLLIRMQRPGATRVAGYRTWLDEFGRHVRKGESAIWIWAPLIARRCPECENSATYHERIGCSYEGTPPAEWSKGLVGFKPVPVFDVAQTEGEPLPELDTLARGDGADLAESLIRAADALDVAVECVPDDAWAHGVAMGVCDLPSTERDQPRIEVRADLETAALAGVLVHEVAHALMHTDEPGETSKREVEAEAVAYVVGRHCGLETSGSALYLAAWAGDDTSTIEDRLERISETVRTVIDAVEGNR